MLQSPSQIGGNRELRVLVAVSTHAGVAAADLPLVAVGILEKNGVIARRVVVAVFRSFHVVRAGLADNRAQTIDLFFAVCAEGDAVGVAAMVRFLVQRDERRHFAVALGVVADLDFRSADFREPQGREEHVVKFPRLCEAGHPQINVVEGVAVHQEKPVPNKHPPFLACIRNIRIHRERSLHATVTFWQGEFYQVTVTIDHHEQRCHFRRMVMNHI